MRNNHIFKVVYFRSVIKKTNKFEWTLGDIRIETVISAAISATNFFLRFQLH